MGRVTLKQIAGPLGLSTFAVSRALSGKDGVSAATRAAVRDAASRLGWHPPVPATPADIGVLFHDLDTVNSELRLQIQNGVQREAQRLARPIRLQWTHLTDDMLALAATCAGLVLVGPHDRTTIAAIGALGVPVVRLGWVDPLEPVDQVAGTDHEAGQAVAAYLLGLGHRAIAYVHGTPGLRGRVERFHGMRDLLARHEDAVLYPMTFDEQTGFAPALRRLRRTGAAPTAFFCAHDGLALTVVSELLALGHRIPDDISVVGFGDFTAATQISPHLTTVRIDGGEMGAAALRLLLERIAAPAAGLPARRVQIVSRIIERRSSGPAPDRRNGGTTSP